MDAALGKTQLILGWLKGCLKLSEKFIRFAEWGLFLSVELILMIFLLIEYLTIAAYGFISSVSCSILHLLPEIHPVHPYTYSLRCDPRLRRHFYSIHFPVGKGVLHKTGFSEKDAYIIAGKSTHLFSPHYSAYWTFDSVYNVQLYKEIHNKAPVLELCWPMIVWNKIQYRKILLHERSVGGIDVKIDFASENRFFEAQLS